VPRGTLDPASCARRFSCTGLSPSPVGFSKTVPLSFLLHFVDCSATPKTVVFGLDSCHFARRYFGNHFCFLFLRVLRCFSSPGLPPRTLCIHVRVPAHYHRWVSPFGHPRLNACLRLTVAFRSLPRPSSAPSAKASALCSYFLDLLLAPCGVRLLILVFSGVVSPARDPKAIRIYFDVGYMQFSKCFLFPFGWWA
jgi:hypothetical protein